MQRLAAVRPGGAYAGKVLVYDELRDTFALAGVGYVPHGKLLDLENRRQLVWVDPVTREWALETAALQVRKEQAEKAAARAAAAAAAARAAAATQAAAAIRAAAASGYSARSVGQTVVFEPPALAGRGPRGIRAKSTHFELKATAGPATRVVYAEPAPDEAAGAPARTSRPDEPAAGKGARPGKAARRPKEKKARRSRRPRAAGRRQFALLGIAATLVAVFLLLAEQGRLGF